MALQVSLHCVQVSGNKNLGMSNEARNRVLVAALPKSPDADIGEKMDLSMPEMKREKERAQICPCLA